MVQGASAVVIMGAVKLLVPHDQPLNGSGKLALLITCAVAGAGGGVVYFFTEPLRSRGGWRAGVANIGTGLAFCGLAIGFLTLAAVTGMSGES